MKRVVVINAYGSKNIGDGAILQVARDLIEESLKEKSQIYIFGEDPKSISDSSKLGHKITPAQIPYGFAIQSSKGKLSYYEKLCRFLMIWIKSYCYLLIGIFYSGILPKKGFYSYIRTIRDSDVVISMGGGYFAPRAKYKDYFGLLLTLLTIYIAKFYKKKILFLPITFGKFISNLQEKITYNAVKGATIICRDKVSLEILERLDKKNNQIRKFWLPDLALFFDPYKSTEREAIEKSYIVLTAREWLDSREQKRYEKALADFIDYIMEKYKLKTVFVSMVYNPLDDDDNIVAKRILKLIKNKNAMSISSAKKPIEVQEVLSNSRLAICTRLHSAILAATVNTPFITIAYGIKTHGFLEMVGLEEWNIDIEKMTYTNLVQKFEKLSKPSNLNKFRVQLKNKLQEIKKNRNSIKKEISDFIYNFR